ncbi:MAG: lgt [Bacteriovoracaceae bacterium]|nr:lgt [Bacteriovoracaceae bacterium]
MYPLLFQIGPLKLYTYGLMMAVGFFTAISWAVRRAPRYGVSAEFISNLSWILVVGGVVGGRLGYIIFEESISDLFSFKLFEVWKGGMVFYGGFIVAVLGALYYSRKHKVPFLTVADIMAPTIALGHAFGRIGCLFAGCCYGKQCTLPWAITFTNPLSLAPLHVPLHPTQLYESIGLFLTVGILLLVQKHQKFMGEIFVVYLSLYAILRTTVETFRGDEDRGFVDFWGLYPNQWLSTSTFIGAGMLAVAAFVFWKYRKVPTSFSAKKN